MREAPISPTFFVFLLGVKVLEPKSCLLLAMPSPAFTESGSWPSSPETGDGNQKSSSKLH